ncbi:MAG: LysR family transcriptional regulator, partial [Alphaproteobacteria bacterium]|nr:LysR family transcriptional regulator [Alphaproteobacteria bacterium]
ATEAAKLLNTTQPAVSKMISNTEEIIGFDLFKSVNRRLMPTPEALDLMPRIERLLGDLRTVQRQAEDLRDGSAGHVAIAGIQTLVMTIGADATTRMLTIHPGVHVELLSLPSADVVESVLNRRVDIGLVYAPISHTELDTIDLGEWNCACVFQKDHAFAAKRVIRPADLQHHPLISFSDQSPVGQGIRDAFREAGEPCHISIVTSSTPTVLFLVAQGAGVGLVDTFACFAACFPQLTARPLDPPVVTRPKIVFLRHTVRSKAVDLFLENLRAVGAKLS